MAGGYVYVLVNEAMPSLIKVGKTTATVNDRAQSLSSATGVPSSFNILKAYAVEDCDAAEAFAHRILERAVGRPNPNREFFNGPADTITHILDDALAVFLTKAGNENLGRFAEALLKVTRKEFTLACLEFEAMFAIEKAPSQTVFDRSIQRIFGAYIACCCTINREPIYPNWLGDVGAKGNILSSAHEVMSAWDGDPIARLLPFFRKYS